MSDHDHPEDEYIDAAAAGEILGKSKRQAQRYGEGPDAPVRTRHDGRRVLYHAGDVRALAEQFKEKEHAPRQQRAEMVRFVDVFDYLRERDARIAQLEEELRHANRRIGQLEGAQDTVRLLRDELATLKGEREAEQQTEQKPEESRRWWPWSRRPRRD